MPLVLTFVKCNIDPREIFAAQGTLSHVGELECQNIYRSIFKGQTSDSISTPTTMYRWKNDEHVATTTYGMM